MQLKVGPKASAEFGGIPGPSSSVMAPAGVRRLHGTMQLNAGNNSLTPGGHRNKILLGYVLSRTPPFADAQPSHTETMPLVKMPKPMRWCTHR